MNHLWCGQTHVECFDVLDLWKVFYICEQNSDIWPVQNSLFQFASSFTHSLTHCLRKFYVRIIILLDSMGTSVLAGLKRQGRGVDHWLPSSIPGLERAKLYLCCPLRLLSTDKGQLYLSTFCLIWYVITALSRVLYNNSNAKSERSRHAVTNRMENHVCVYTVVSLPRPANKAGAPVVKPHSLWVENTALLTNRCE